MSSPAERLYLRDVLNIPENVLAGDFKVDLSGGFGEPARRVAEYVVTPQLDGALRSALNLVRGAVLGGKSEAAYLHGSFGSGKSHFMTVLHAVLDGHPAARAKPGLQKIIADHDDWLRGRRFMMVPFHLIGSTDLDSAILGKYAQEARRQGLSTPAVYRSDAMLADARTTREIMGDDIRFAEWLAGGRPTPAADPDDLPDLGGDAGGGRWSTAELDRALSAPHGDPLRTALESALLDGPMSSYALGASGASGAYLPLEDGLAEMSRHAHRHGFDGLILFLDELILWLQAHMSNQEKVNTEVGKLVKLIESGNADRPVPIVSFISRQRNLSQLVGADVVGADVKNLENQVEYLAGRFNEISLEDRNLPAIIKERVLRPRKGMEAALAAAFAAVESSNSTAKDALLDAHGATSAGWDDFRDVYPLSPALLNVLVALSGALQRERTGLKMLSQMLVQRRDMEVGQIIPLGDLWDVLTDGVGEAFTDHLRAEAEAARQFHAKVHAHLLEKYGSADHERLRADERIVKTLILSALAPDVPALSRLTGPRLAALNLGSIRSRTVPPGSMVVSRLRELIGAGFGQIRADGDSDPVFTLHLSDLDVEPLLEQVGGQDTPGARRIWIKNRLWEALGVADTGAFVSEREIVWRGTRRTVEFVFENVRDPAALPRDHFRPSVPGRIRFVLDYPFDTDGYPSDDAGRVDELRRDGLEADTLVWLCDHFSTQVAGQLGRLLKINYLLERDRLDDYAGHLASDQRIRVRHQLQAQADNLTSQLSTVLQQVYGISAGGEENVSAEVSGGRHVLCLRPGFDRPTLHGAAGFEYNMLALADELYGRIYPRHPDFDTAGNRKAVTLGELKTVLSWITKAMEDGSRRVVVDRDKLGLLRRIVHPLELGEVHDGPLNVTTDWQRRIEQRAAALPGAGGDFAVEDIRQWIAELGWTGLDRPVANLIIATYALLSDRVWVFNGTPAPPPELERIGPGWALRELPKPSEEEFAAARLRAGRLFGIRVPQTLFTRNVTRLAAEVRAKAGALENDVHNVRRALERHADDLGVDEQAPRLRSARHAADLIARLSAEPCGRDDTALVRELAAATYDVTDEVLGTALTSAPDVLRALNAQDAWTLLASVRGFTGRADDLGEQARRLVEEIAETARNDEFSHRLPPVLSQARAQAVALISEAGRRAQVVTPPTPPTPPAPGGDGAGRPQRAGRVSLTDHGTPPVSGAGGTRRVRTPRREADLSEAFAAVRDEIRAYAAAHPDIAIEIMWRPVQDGDR